MVSKSWENQGRSRSITGSKQFEQAIGIAAQLPIAPRSNLGYSYDKKINHNNKVIITCAVTGAIHTHNVSYLPITPDEITADAIAAAEAGAAILHLHARNPETGQPDQSPEGLLLFCLE